MRVVEQHAQDIETMRVRGAGAIARHAADALGEWAAGQERGDGFAEALRAQVDRLQATRPTAVSLHSALSFVSARAGQRPGDPAAVVEAAAEFARRSREALARIGEAGAGLVRDGGTYLTHCNSQAALAPFRAARKEGRSFTVYATETRPWRQGHLTARQLADMGAETRFIVDSAAYGVLGAVDAVFVGCDTLAANGDVVNKVGTAPLALACRERGVPFRVCAESYKVDLDAATGDAVPIEERPITEVADAGELADGVTILNPVFDVTPHAWVLEVLTEEGAVAPEKVAAVARAAWH